MVTQGGHKMWLNAASMLFKAGSHIYKNRQQTKMLMSDAERLHAERLAKGEIEYKKEIIHQIFNFYSSWILFEFT